MSILAGKQVPSGASITEGKVDSFPPRKQCIGWDNIYIYYKIVQGLQTKKEKKEIKEKKLVACNILNILNIHIFII